MSSNSLIKVSSITVPKFNAEKATKWASGLDNASASLNKVRNILEKIMKFISPFLSLISGNILSTIFKKVLKILEEVIKTILSTGVKTIFIHL